MSVIKASGCGDTLRANLTAGTQGFATVGWGAFGEGAPFGVEAHVALEISILEIVLAPNAH